MWDLQPPRHISTLPNRDQVGAGNKRRSGPRLCENSEVEFSDRRFVSASSISKTNNAGDRCQAEAIEKTILRVLRSHTFSHSLGQKRPRQVRQLRALNAHFASDGSITCATRFIRPTLPK